MASRKTKKAQDALAQKDEKGLHAVQPPDAQAGKKRQKKAPEQNASKAERKSLRERGLDLKALVEQQMAAIDENEVWHFEAGTMSGDTSMEHWYPAVSRIVSTPMTHRVPVPGRCNLFRLLDGEKPLHWADFLSRLSKDVRNLRQCLPSMPAVFLRTSYTSGKHDWKRTCFLESIEDRDIEAHVRAIVEFSAMIDQPVDCFWVREMVETVPVFHAFNGMPITREYRLRVVDGHVTHIQPYWPEKAFEDEEGLPGNWQALLRKSWRIGRRELNRLVSMTEKIGKALGRDWSVDWLQASGGTWYCTDLAAGPLSYWWDAKEADFVEGAAHA